MEYRKARKVQCLGRWAICGTTGTGKTTAALIAARELADGGNIAVLDLDGGARQFAEHLDFDLLELTAPYSPDRVERAIAAADAYSVLVINGFSREYSGPGGVKTLVDAGRQSGLDTSNAWSGPGKAHDHMMAQLLGDACHVVVTVDAAEIWEPDGAGNIRRIGGAPDQRPGLSRFFDGWFRLEGGQVRAERWNYSARLEHVVVSTEAAGPWLAELAGHLLEGERRASPDEVAELVDFARAAATVDREATRDICESWGIEASASALRRWGRAAAALDAAELASDLEAIADSIRPDDPVGQADAE